MKNTQIEKKKPAALEHPARVTFVPSEEDYVHIAASINAAQPGSLAFTYLYWVFLFLNLICFPAYLLFQGYLLPAFIVFIIGGIFVIFLLPESERKTYRKFYRDLARDEQTELEVELLEKGIRCARDGDESLIAWKNITDIQESGDSIYFFVKQSGIPVSKTAFGSEEQEKSFVNFARERVRSAKLGLD
jgi:hypothetical protein